MSDRSPDPTVGATLSFFQIPRLLAPRRGHHYNLIVQLLETPIQFQQKVLPLRALAVRFAVESQQQWKKMLDYQAFVRTIVGGEQRSLEGTRIGSICVEKRFPSEFRVTHNRPLRLLPLPSHRPFAKRRASPEGPHTGRPAGTVTIVESGN